MNTPMSNKLQEILSEAKIKVVDAPIPTDCMDGLCYALDRCDCLNEIAEQVKTGDNPPKRLIEAAINLLRAAEEQGCPIFTKKET